MKRLLVVLWVAVCVCAARPALADMLPVGQFPRDTAWTETIDTVNGSVEVDITISLPDIASLPVYEVAYRQFSVDALRRLFPQADISLSETGVLVQQGDLSGSIYPIDADDCTWTEWPEDSDYAEDATESKQEVESWLQERCRGLYEDGQTSLWTRGVCAHSRTWRKQKGGEPTEPVNAHGYYSFYLERAMDGVTVFDNLFFDRDGQGNFGPHAESTMLCYYDENNFEILLSDFEIIRTVAEDVPILSLDAIEATLRTLISTGHLREIYRIELCYLPMWSDARDSIITVPAWVVHGEYHESAKSPNYEDTDNYFLRTLGGFPLIIPAQTGQVIDNANSAPNRWLASTYLTEW